MKRTIQNTIFLCGLLQLPYSCCAQTGQTKFSEAIHLVQTNQFEQGLELLLKLSERHPNNPKVLYNTAYTLKQLCRMAQAIPFYERAVLLDAEQAAMHLGLAKAYLATGNFARGWQEFEYRMANQKKYREKYPIHDLVEANLQNKTVLIKSEWGLGDMIQFVPRYAKVLKEAGVKKIIAHTFPPLVQLFSCCDHIDQAIPLDQPAAGYDIQIPALSLPLICKTKVETIPINIPYLQADQNLVNHWHEQLQKIDSGEKLRIGLCWQAKPEIFLEQNPLTKRSIPLKLFAPLAELEHVQLYSLQKQFGTSQLENISWNIHKFDADFDNSNGRFMDTAAVIENLDLIISVDTAIVHLAGALGAPVWVLLPRTPEWRWQLHKTETPWYPNVRLFKQKKTEDWSSVILQIKDLLCTF